MSISTKLSDLIAATAAGGDLIYIVQGGNSRKVTLGAVGARLLEDTGYTGALTSIGVTALGRSLLDDTGQTKARATLGLGSSAIVDTGTFLSDSGAFLSDSIITPFGRSILDDTGQTTVRTTLGLGTASTKAESYFALAPYDMLAAAQAATIPTTFKGVTTLGHTTHGDGGGADWIDTGEQPTTHEAWFKDAASHYFIIRNPKLDIRQFGVFGSDDTGGMTNEGTNILKAFTAAIKLKRPLFVPGRHYQSGALSYTTDDIALFLEGDPSGRPIFHPTQTVANGTGSAGRLFQFLPGNYTGSEAGSYTLAANVSPYQQTITLNSVTGILPGMMIQLASDQLWYYDDRGTYYRGEIHLIQKVISTTNQVVIDDYTRDVYLTSQTITVRVWTPRRFIWDNIGIEYPPPNDTGSSNTRGLVIDRMLKPEFNDCLVKGMTGSGILNSRSWLARYNNLEIQDVGRGTSASESIGYGVNEASVYGSVFRGTKSRGCRRTVDFDSLSTQNLAAVSRDCIFEDFHITGSGTTSGIGEIIQEPSFDATTGWVTTAPWAISGGNATRTGGSAGNLYAEISGFVPGETVSLNVEVSSISGSTFKLAFYQDATPTGTETSVISTTGTHNFSLTVPSGTTRLYVIATGSALNCVLARLSMYAISYWHPDGTVPNYGIGGHGPVENLIIRNGYIADVTQGVNIRSRNTHVSGVRFAGELEYCFFGTFGTGLTMKDCSYMRDDYPSKTSDTGAANTYFSKLPFSFARFAIAKSDGDWDYESPVVIQNCDAHGLQRSFVEFGTTNGQSTAIENVYAHDNTARLHIPSGSVFNFFFATDSGDTRLWRSKIGPNKMVNRGAGTVNMYHSAFVLGNVAQGGDDAAIEVGDHEYIITIPDDDAGVIRDAIRYSGDRLTILMADQSNNTYGHFILSNASSTTISLGAMSATLAASAVGSTLAGTTGTDGNFTVGLTNGDLYMENRTGATRRLRIRLM